MEQNSKNGDKKSLSFMFAKVTIEKVTKIAITFYFSDGSSKFKVLILWYREHYQIKSFVVATIIQIHDAHLLRTII